MVSRNKALAILSRHGWQSTDNTLWDTINLCWVEDSGFDAEMGIQESYSLIRHLPVARVLTSVKVRKV